MHGYFWSKSSNKRETNILAVLRFKLPFERDTFRFNPFGTFPETTFKQVMEIRVLALYVIIVFVDTRHWKTKHPRKRFQNFITVQSLTAALRTYVV